MNSFQRPDFNRLGKGALETLGGFKTFILRGNVVDLAVGIVIGTAFTSVVTAFVTDIITPVIPIGNSNLSDWILHPPYGTGIKIGAFIDAIISFIIVAAIVYFFVVRPVGFFLERYKPQKVEINTRDCPYCLQSIPLLATRCSYCTSPVPPLHPQADAGTGAVQ